MLISTIDTKSCAKFIIRLSEMRSHGVYNLGARDQISKKDFALKFAKKINKNLKYVNKSVDSGEVKRGKYLGLDVKKIQTKLKIKMPTINKVINNIAQNYL